MTRQPHRKLAIPTLLVATALGGSPSCKDESSDDTNADSTADSGTDTTISGEDECYDIPEMSACENEAAFECRWEAEIELCLPNCPAYPDQAACDDDFACMWVGNACTDAAI